MLAKGELQKDSSIVEKKPLDDNVENPAYEEIPIYRPVD